MSANIYSLITNLKQEKKVHLDPGDDRLPVGTHFCRRVCQVQAVQLLEQTRERLDDGGQTLV